MGVLREFRSLRDTIEQLNITLKRLAEHQAAAGPALERLEGLELSRSKWEAEIEGILLKSDGKLKAASAAEARERSLKKSYEKQQLDPFDLDSEQAEASIVQGRHAPASEEERMLPLHLDVAPVNSKAYALRAKYQL